MDCGTARKLIPAFVDGELPDSPGLEAHIAECSGCSQELAAQKALLHALGAWSGIESSRSYADFRTHVDNVQRRSRWWQPVWHPAPRWVAAALILMAFLGGSVTGIRHSAQITPHSHVISADMELASASLELDAFGGGLSDVVTADVVEVAK